MELYSAYNEEAWIKTVFLLSDLQGWLQQTERSLFYSLPISCKKGLFRPTYCLGCGAMAHILERHYYKISRHPNCSKFTIPVADIVTYIRQAAPQAATPVANSVYLQRTLITETIIGLDRHNQPTNTITVVTDAGGRIVTAFPGHL